MRSTANSNATMANQAVAGMVVPQQAQVFDSNDDFEWDVIKVVDVWKHEHSRLFVKAKVRTARGTMVIPNVALEKLSLDMHGYAVADWAHSHTGQAHILPSTWRPADDWQHQQ